MFSTVAFTATATSASASIASSAKSRVTPSVCISATYCLMSEASGSVRMRRMSSRVSAFSSTRIGSRPCSSGNRSDGLAMWNAPDAINRMWSVFTAPCLVDTVVPSISGSRSRCTPSRETSPTRAPSRTQILSISSRNTMPLFSTTPIASCTTWSSSSSLSDSSATRISWESATVMRRVLVRPPSLPKMSPIEIAPICAPGMPGISNIGAPPDDCTSTSISLSLSSPARSLRRNESRVAALALAPTSASSTRSSAAIWARACTSLRLRSRTWVMPTSIRSRTICSTSRPT